MDRSEAADAVAADVVLGIVPVVVAVFVAEVAAVFVAMMMQCFTRLHENRKKSSRELCCNESEKVLENCAATRVGGSSGELYCDESRRSSRELYCTESWRSSGELYCTESR